MVLHNSGIKLTANIGVCLKKTNLRILPELSGDALIRGLSFINYFLKQDSNIKLIFSFQQSELQKLLNYKSDLVEKILDQNLTNYQKVKLLVDYHEKWYFKAHQITDVALLYKFNEIRILLETDHPSLNCINKKLSDPITDLIQFQEFAKNWVFSIRGLEYTALIIDALFNEDGEIYYDGQNPLIKERNCPIIASLLN